MANTPEEHVQMILGALGAVFAGDPEPLKACCDPHVVVHEPPYLPYGGDYRGTDGFLELFSRATKVLDSASAEVVAAVADQDRVVLLMTTKCFGYPERFTITEHWVLRDDKIVDVRVFWYDPPFSATG